MINPVESDVRLLARLALYSVGAVFILIAIIWTFGVQTWWLIVGGALIYAGSLIDLGIDIMFTDFSDATWGPDDGR